MRGSRKKGARKGAARPEQTSAQPSTPSERQEAADRAKSMRQGGEELVPAAKIAKGWGLSVEVIRRVIDELELQPDYVENGCAYYSPSTVQRIKEHLKR